MKRCALSTCLHLRAPLPRTPWLHSRLPHPARTFSLATRLAKDHDAEANHAESSEGKTDGKKSDQKCKDKKPGRKKAKGDEDGGQGSTKPREKKDGGENKNEVKEPKAQSKRTKKSKSNDEKDGPKKSTTKVTPRRVRARAAKAAGSDNAINKKIAQMRKEIDEINKRNKKVLDPKGTTIRRVAGGTSLKDALLGGAGGAAVAKEGRKRPREMRSGGKTPMLDFEKLDIKHLNPEELDFQPVDYKIPPVPRLSYGLDRVLFNPGIYRLQDPRTRVYNFDPYLEKIMSVSDFNFSALSEYKTSSKDEELLALTKKMETKFTGSTSSMSGVLQHFHFLLSNFRELNHDMLSREFPKPSSKYSKITLGPSAIFLRRKDDLYAIDADKAYDTPNIMSWLGHSLEKLLTVDRKEFERYRRSSGDAVPGEDESGRCYHYSKLGNFLMRSQLDAYDPRLPGKGIFDLKTRAVVSIRMNHKQWEAGKGYQIRYDRGEWESYEREFHDMARATMLKYSLQVRMGRMDGIFVAYHNVERIFGFQYLPIEDMDLVLHGQKDPCLGDQEFKMSISLLDELMQKATEQYPDQVRAPSAAS